MSGRAVAKGIWALLMIPGGIVLTLALMVATVALVLLVPPVAFAFWADLAFPKPPETMPLPKMQPPFSWPDPPPHDTVANRMTRES